jgi:hypothetical protein
MTSIEQEPQLRVVDHEGNVFIGSAMAGRYVRVEVARDGIFLRFVGDAPDGDAWWIKQPEKLKKALDWTEETSSPISQAVVEASVVVEEPTKKKRKAKKGKRKKR